MKAVYFAAILLLAGTVSCTPAHQIIDLPEWFPDINLPEIIGTIREVISQIFDILGIELPQLPNISIQQIFERILEALGIDADIDWENLTLEQILVILGISLPDIDWENITLEEILEIIITRIQEIISEIELPEININRPIEGTSVAITSQPSVVQVEAGIGSVWVQVCAGSIITNFHILSVAKCFSGQSYDASRRRVRAGSSSRYSGGIINAVDIAVNNDELCVVRLVSPFAFTDTVQTTNIIAPNFVTPPGASVNTAGWGISSQGGIVISDRDLYQVSLTVIDRDACAEQWSRFREVTPNHICAGRSETGGRDADARDVGAPLIYSDILVGVQSFGKYIGNQRYPIGYINVAGYTNWIIENAT